MRAEAGPLQQRHRGVLGQFQDPLVEVEPGELAVEIEGGVVDPPIVLRGPRLIAGLRRHGRASARGSPRRRLQCAPVAGGELRHRALPGTLAGGAGAGLAELAAQAGRGGELQQRPRQVVGVGAAEEAGVAVLDQRRRPTLGDGDDRQAAGRRLEDHLAVGVGAAAEEEGVGAGVSARQVLAGEPAEEGGAFAEPLAQLGFLGTAAGEQQVQARIGLVGAEEGLGQQVDSLFAGQAAGVEDLDLAWEGVTVGLGRVEAVEVDAPLPATDPSRVGAERGNRGIGRGTWREDRRRGRVEGAEASAGQRLQGAVLAAHAGVGGDLGVIAGQQRHAGDPAHQGRGDPGRTGGGDVDEVVGALGQGLDQVREAGDAEGHPLVEGDLQLGGGREAAVDAGVGADDVDLEAGDAALADLFDRVGDPVHRADPVGDHGDPLALTATIAQLRLLGTEEGGGRRVGDRRDEGGEETVDGGLEVAVGDRLGAAVDGLPQAPVVGAAGAPVEIGVGELVGLHVIDQLAAAQLRDRPRRARPRAGRGHRRGRHRRRSCLRGRRPRGLPAPPS